MNETPRTKAVFAEMGNMDKLLPKLNRIGEHALLLEVELAQANEYARKLSIKVTDQGVEIQRLQATLQRKQDAGDLLFEELDDKTPEPNCSCHLFPPCSDCENHAASRAALKAWKEANK